MNILILSRKWQLHSTRRMKEECEKLGHKPLIKDPLKCVLEIADEKPSLLYNGRACPPIDAVIPRVGTYGTGYAIAVVRHLEMMGVPSVNGHAAIARAKDKLGCLQLLLQSGIGVPRTIISRYPRHLQKLTKRVGGTPVVLKLLRGTHGTGVIYSESQQAVESVLETIWSLGEDIMLQELIQESKGQDLRVLIVDGKVAAVMRRMGAPGEFRSNIHRGGMGIPVKDLPAEYARVAVKAAKAVGLRIAGVDILESDRGPLVIEVNASPGFQGLEEATGMNVARMIVDYAIRIGQEGQSTSRTG